MESIQDVIRAPDAYLFVVQMLIVVIAGLLLSVIWFLIGRIKNAPNEDLVAPEVHGEAPVLDAAASIQAAAPVAPSAAPAEVVAPTPSVAPASIANAAPQPAPAPEVKPEVEVVSLAIGEPMAALSSAAAKPVSDSGAGAAAPEEVAARKEEVRVLNEESEMLRDKVKYLESRLMEYEIVQEEISSLSQLRVENEKLKEELLKAGGARPVSAPAAPPPASVPPLDPANPVLDNVSEGQIDTILKKLDQLTSAPIKE